jgi:hypothetical protein
MHLNRVVCLGQERAAQRQLLTADELQGAIRAIQAAADDACLELATCGEVLRKALAEDSPPDEVICLHLQSAALPWDS